MKKEYSKTALRRWAKKGKGDWAQDGTGHFILSDGTRLSVKKLSSKKVELTKVNAQGEPIESSNGDSSEEGESSDEEEEPSYNEDGITYQADGLTKKESEKQKSKQFRQLQNYGKF